MIADRTAAVATDHFSALFSHFSPSAQAFFSGNLCTLAEFNDPRRRGYLHVLRSGRLTVTQADGADLHLTEPSVLLALRHAPHGFHPDPEIGADLACALVDIGPTPIAMGLPDLLVIPFSGMGQLAPTLTLLLEEAFAERDGRQVALDRLFEYLLIQMLRFVVSERPVAAGVLAAMSDARLALAMAAIHERPDRDWSLEDMAAAANMSRTRFAAHFRQIVGTTPMEYLTRWRMSVAQNLLRKGKPIKSVASAVGYDSPAAMTRVFTKTVGQSPKAWLAHAAAG